MKSLKYLFLLSIAFLTAFLSLAQNKKSYDASWKYVEELIEKKNLPKTALEEVKSIYARAKKEGQDAHIIKALFYMGVLQQENRESNQQLAIRELEKELTQLKEPSLSIAQSMLADRYWQYFQNHRWQLYNRTSTVNFIKTDIATWSTDDFHRRIAELYLASLKNKDLLQKTRTDVYRPIVIKGNVSELRPTLYDLLAHRALNYFTNDERDIRKPSYAFQINQPEAFAPAATFAKVNFTTSDTSSLYFRALRIYQNLVSFHLNDAQPDALIDVDIARIEFVRRVSVIPNKDERYKQALETITQKWDTRPAAKQAWFLLAAIYHQQGLQYDPLKDTTHRFAIVKAKELLEKVVRDSSIKNEGWTNSYNLLREINKPAFSFQIEKVNVPGQPFRALIQYKNLASLNLRLIKADSATKMRLREMHNEKNWQSLVSVPALRNWKQTLPATNDLQQHYVEVKIDALPIGEYILLATPDVSFNAKSSQLGAQFFHVSNISYIHQGNQFFVLQRETGQPLANAAIQVYTQEYDYRNYRYNKKKAGSYQADKNGQFSLTASKEDRGYLLEIKHNDDYLNLDDYLYSYYFNSIYANNKSAARIFYFTDRSLYRPGQIVFVKGIAIRKEGNNNQVQQGFKTTVYLRNANSELVDSLEVTTNEFGSFNARFQLPQQVLNGHFYITSKDQQSGSVSFAVEEYKRPKFYVGFDPVKETYKAGDTITITGSAKAYAGNNIDNARVTYRVVRQPRFIYPWLTWRWLPRGEPMEIIHGETVTGADGKFTIRFTAIPDNKIDPKLDPVFDYRIYTDVTDINGETRSGENLVSAGYKSLLLKVQAPEKLAVDSLKSITVRTENMNGVYQQSNITVSVTQLIPEKRLIRKRYWQQPDQFVMSKEEFISHFPYDEYRNETNYQTWEKGPEVFRKTDSTRANGLWPINNHGLKAGVYEFEFTTKDREGNEVKDIRYVELFDAKQNALSTPSYLWTSSYNKNIEPGERTTIHVGSAAPQVFLIQQIDRSENNEKTNDTFNYFSLNNEKKPFVISTSEADRGGFGIHFFFVKHNRFYQSANVVDVPWSNKELDITYSTFRDRILPGSTEKWEVKLTGQKGEKAAAEILASMYDASLDQFYPHQWQKPAIWPTYAGRASWQGAQNFNAVHSQERWLEELPYRFFEKRYDRFFFDHSYGGAIPLVRMKGKAANARDAAVTEMAAPGAPERDEAASVQNFDLKMEEVTISSDSSAANPSVNNAAIQIRKNFNETAFFFPDLKTDANGNVTFSFTAPEALTQWKLQTFAHTKEGAFGLSQKEVITQKELMVQPNTPRFLRQGDRIELSVKIVNLSDKEFTGQAELLLMDAATNQSVDGWFQNVFPNQYFTVAAGQSDVVKFPIEVPYTFNSALVWRVIARTNNLSDGEEAAIPVLSNKMLVTETLPLPMRGAGTRNFSFTKLINANSATLQHHALTIEYTSNPAWYAVQALPYLMQQDNEHAEQIWNRYYANALALKIVHSAPRIRQIFESWKSVDTAALLSNLQKNGELKSILLAETPWVLQAKTETEQKKNIALLFDLVRMSGELKESLRKLQEMQSPNGGFVWLKGAPDDRYMTQYIVTGIGHLKKLGALPKENEQDLQTILNAALPYLDKKMKEDHDRLVKSKADLKSFPPDEMQVQYLYMRSFFPEYRVANNAQTAYQYYKKQAQLQWMKRNKYTQGMIALALHRSGERQTPIAILKSLKETAIQHEELGMYWYDNSFGRSWYWWHAPIETQSLLIEAFAEISNDNKTVDDLKTWLIKNKQTNNWRTTKATAEACYAMLLQGTNWLANDPAVTITLGNTIITSGTGEVKAEAGTGYFKKTIEPQFIKPAMGEIKVTVQPGNNQQTTASSWGAAYWQYFEDLDKITTASTPLKIDKKLFIEKNTDRGPVLTPVSEGTPVQIGDKIKVRIEIRVDRDMEYVHMKDMRSSALEPVNVLSGYKWQGGLGYYETTKDASTNFFFQYLRKGTYVFEYPLFVNHAGNFSNGITSIQCLYAPEFSAHSSGIRLSVE